METEGLISLEKHNSDVSRRNWGVRRQTPVPNGIACPECGGELWDSEPMYIYTSNPPQKRVDCPVCGYQSMRVAL